MILFLVVFHDAAFNTRTKNIMIHEVCFWWTKLSLPLLCKWFDC